MKNDFFFKFVAAIIVAGVIAAFASPNQTAKAAPAAAADSTATAPSAPSSE